MTARKSLNSPWVTISLALFLAWAAGLITLAVVVDSPVTLNHVQIRNANLIVQGTPDPATPDLFIVERSWPEHSTVESVMIRDLDELSLSPKQSTLIPLQLTSNGSYEVVLTPEPTNVRLTYPATDDAIESLTSLLSGNGQ